VVVDSADNVKVLVQNVTLIVAGSPGLAVKPPTNDEDVGVGTIGSTSAVVTRDVTPSANVCVIVIHVVNSLRFDGVGRVGGEETAAGVVELGTMVEEMELESGRAESLKGKVEAVVGLGLDDGEVVAN
jgi:hypothetical protein